MELQLPNSILLCSPLTGLSSLRLSDRKGKLFLYLSITTLLQASNQRSAKAPKPEASSSKKWFSQARKCRLSLCRGASMSLCLPVYSQARLVRLGHTHG